MRPVAGYQGEEISKLGKAMEQMSKSIRKRKMYSSQLWRNYMLFRSLSPIPATPPHQMNLKE